MADRKSASEIWIWWWSVPRWSATDWANSRSTLPGIPIENVFKGKPAWYLFTSAEIKLESRPPERSDPISRSAIIRFLTANFKRLRIPFKISFSFTLKSGSSLWKWYWVNFPEDSCHQCPGLKGVILLHVSTNGLASEAMNISLPFWPINPGRTPKGSLPAKILSLSRSCKTNINTPSKALIVFSMPYFLYIWRMISQSDPVFKSNPWDDAKSL